ALNVVIRMEPTLNRPFNVRSFFTDRELRSKKMGEMLINIDISTGLMYKRGPLIQLCMEFIKRQGSPLALAPS
ncbi:hypothetical protein MPER_00476, partial [Moniliophthora perniciosa FA553]